ncbi:unnamed protein product [Schistocephalus solidus]|uniref:Uncharacterized protein n=1 Tax=Schistocephalus solidus TaxID=70667 RepID=A0A183SZ56_SCHSO|nr:unnamed protein product [Schistocephalus solidus]
MYKLYSESKGSFDNLRSQLSKDILNNFRDWRRLISVALSVLRSFDDYGLNQVRRDYGCVWHTQALELSATLTERKKMAEQYIHEALVNLRRAFKSSSSMTENNDGEGSPESALSGVEPGEDSPTKVRNAIEILEKSLSEEIAALLGDNGVATCCINVNKNLHLIAANFIPIRHPRPTKPGVPETAEPSLSLLDRLKSKAASCIQDLESTLHLIEASMREVDSSDYLHFHLSSGAQIIKEPSHRRVDSKRQKPDNETHTKFQSDQTSSLKNAILILDCWIAALPRSIYNEIRILEEEMDGIFEKNMHALCSFDVIHVFQTAVGAKSEFLKRLWHISNSGNPEPETTEAIKALEEELKRLKFRVGKFTSDVLSAIKSIYVNEVYCAKNQLNMSQFQNISSSVQNALDLWSSATSSLIDGKNLTVKEEQVTDPIKEPSWQESEPTPELSYLDHKDKTLRKRRLLQNEAMTPARVEACGTVLKQVTSVLETDLAYQLQRSLPETFAELKAITEANLQLNTELISAEAELRVVRDETALYSAELMRIEYEIGAVIGTTERISALTSES